MSFTRTTISAIVAVAVSGLLVAGALAASTKPSVTPSSSMPGMHMKAGAAMTAADLRVLLDKQRGRRRHESNDVRRSRRGCRIACRRPTWRSVRRRLSYFRSR